MADMLDIVRRRSAKAAQAINSLDRLRGLNLDVSPLQTELGDYVAWLIINRGYSDATLYAYARGLVEWFFWLSEQDIDYPCATIQHAERHSRDLFVTGGLSASTRNLRLAGIRSFYNWRAAEGLGSSSASQVMGAKIAKPTPKKYTEQETRKLSQACNLTKSIGVRDRAMLMLALGAGLRREEIALSSLDWLQLGAGKGTINIQGKGAKERSVGISKPVVDALNAWLAVRAGIPEAFEHGRLFVALPKHLRGDVIAVGVVNACLNRLHRLAGLPISGHVHKLRTTYATEVYKDCRDIRRVQYLLGHNDITTTERYIALAESELKAGMATNVVEKLTGASHAELPSWFSQRS